jgi:folylpolyglutamate synthase/dihydropteroate synthase
VSDFRTLRGGQVLEAGVGGRWDCTNHCTPTACAITRATLKHKEQFDLAESKETDEVASDIAGIIKRNVPVWTHGGTHNEQQARAMTILNRVSNRVAGNLWTANGAAEEGVHLERARSLTPAHQQGNLRLAESIVYSHLGALGLQVPQVPPGIDRVRWYPFRDACYQSARPGRFEVLRPQLLSALDDLVLVLDVARTATTIWALLNAVVRIWPTLPVALIFGSTNDCDIATLLALFSALGGRMRRGVAVASNDEANAVGVDEIVQEALRSASARGFTSMAADTQRFPTAGAAAQGIWSSANSMREAIQLAAESPAQTDDGRRIGVVLCCGSVCAVADLRTAVAAVEPHLFASGDWVRERLGEPVVHAEWSAPMLPRGAKDSKEASKEASIADGSSEQVFGSSEDREAKESLVSSAVTIE